MTIEVGLDDRGRWPSSVGRADQGRPLREKRVSPRRPLRESVPVLVGRKCVGLPCDYGQIVPLAGGDGYARVRGV